MCEPKFKEGQTVQVARGMNVGVRAKVLSSPLVAFTSHGDIATAPVCYQYLMEYESEPGKRYLGDEAHYVPAERWESCKGKHRHVGGDGRGFWNMERCVD